jgi:hypothetical protein
MPCSLEAEEEMAWTNLMEFKQVKVDDYNDNYEDDDDSDGITRRYMTPTMKT